METKTNLRQVPPSVIKKLQKVESLKEQIEKICEKLQANPFCEDAMEGSDLLAKSILLLKASIIKQFPEEKPPKQLSDMTLEERKLLFENNAKKYSKQVSTGDELPMPSPKQELEAWIDADFSVRND